MNAYSPIRQCLNQVALRLATRNCVADARLRDSCHAAARRYCLLCQLPTGRPAAKRRTDCRARTFAILTSVGGVLLTNASQHCVRQARVLFAAHSNVIRDSWCAFASRCANETQYAITGDGVAGMNENAARSGDRRTCLPRSLSIQLKKKRKKKKEALT